MITRKMNWQDHASLSVSMHASLSASICREEGGEGEGFEANGVSW